MRGGLSPNPPHMQGYLCGPNPRDLCGQHRDTIHTQGYVHTVSCPEVQHYGVDPQNQAGRGEMEGKKRGESGENKGKAWVACRARLGMVVHMECM